MISKKIALVIFLFIPSLLWASPSEVTLFEQNRSKMDVSKQATKEPVPVASKKKTGKTLNKKLIGIQRFGQQYTLIFKTKRGQQERFIWAQKDNQKPVEIEPGFTIDQVEQRRVKIKLSQQVRCEADKKRRIECPDAEHMNLGIQRNKAIIKPGNRSKIRKNAKKSSAYKKAARPGVKKADQQEQSNKVKNPFLKMKEKSQGK